MATVALARSDDDTASDRLSALEIVVDAEANRPVSFTNKRSAFYYTQTHRNNHPEHAGFRGLNIAKRQIFSGYALQHGDRELDPAGAVVSVRPDRLRRLYPDGVVETLTLFDHQDVVQVSISGATEPLGISLLGDAVHRDSSTRGVAVYRNDGVPQWRIAVAAVAEIPVESSTKTERAPATSGGFLIAVADSTEAAVTLIGTAREQSPTWAQQRRARMNRLLSGPAMLESDDPDLQRALNWITLNLDQLVTEQHGQGIYAGLPWFNEYWGRDSFIALPGAALVSGQFETARHVLTDFARFQDRDPASRFHGRIPNIVNPDQIDYHTTDGTPRFVIQARRYVEYSGDDTLARELFPSIRASIEGALENWVDESGYLLHADNETWMDARREPDKLPYSPRGTRANDIQALWHEQLRAGAYFARAVDDDATADRWEALADRLARSFVRDFIDPDRPYPADHLNADGSPDLQVRPNAFYALDLIENPDQRVPAVRHLWQELVYPWGVASLDRHDPDFHPYHWAPGQWHKDAAYHNGTVWLWNNGIAMQRMIEAGRPELAWRLFQNMNRMALERGVVGGLAENSDAYPRPGQALPRLTGTYLQAWSNAEHLRVFHRHFLGIRPDRINDLLVLAPRLPASAGAVRVRVRIGAGWLDASFEPRADPRRYRYRFETLSTGVRLDLPGYDPVDLAVRSGDRLDVEHGMDGLTLKVTDAGGEVRTRVDRSPSPERLAAWQARRQALDGTSFCTPLDPADHPVLQAGSSVR